MVGITSAVVPLFSVSTTAISFRRGGARATPHELGWELGNELRQWTAGGEQLARPKAAIRSGGLRASQQRRDRFRLACVGGSAPPKTNLIREGSTESTAQADGRVLPEFANAEEEGLFDFLDLQLESDINIDQMRHYEVVFLVHEDCLEEVPKVIVEVEEFIKEKKGKIWRMNDWGLRKLAYKIRKAENANYVLMNFEIGSKWVNDFKRMLDKDERVIRHLVMKRDEAITEFCPPPPEFHTLRSSMVDDDDDAELEDENMESELNS